MILDPEEKNSQMRNTKKKQRINQNQKVSKEYQNKKKIILNNKKRKERSRKRQKNNLEKRNKRYQRLKVQLETLNRIYRM